jgi:hypothetical protein
MPVDVAPEFEHEHAFFRHEDPRYLICRCGQYAVHTRTDHGQSNLRLIDPPTPVLLRPRTASSADLTEGVAVARDPQVV